MADRPRLLDLFCGAGGAAMGYHRAGFDIVGIDIVDQPHYPFKLHVVDACAVLAAGGWWSGWPERGAGVHHLLTDFDVVHASPPCQQWTAYHRSTAVAERPNLIPAVREHLQATGLPYVIENIPGAPLHNPIQLCGSSFGLDVRRHRLFESNVALMAPPCAHGTQAPRFPPATNRTNLRRTVEIGVWRIPLATQQAAMGVDWMALTELSQAIPPAFTTHIGSQLIDALQAAA